MLAHAHCIWTSSRLKRILRQTIFKEPTHNVTDLSLLAKQMTRSTQRTIYLKLKLDQLLHLSLSETAWLLMTSIELSQKRMPRLRLWRDRLWNLMISREPKQSHDIKQEKELNSKTWTIPTLLKNHKCQWDAQILSTRSTQSLMKKDHVRSVKLQVQNLLRCQILQRTKQRIAVVASPPMILAVHKLRPRV